MADYDYKEGKKRIIDILSSKTVIEIKDKIPENDSDFTYGNGIKTFVGALFVDIRNSTEYFKNNKEDIIGRVMRAFCSEIITILQEDSNFRQIGIRGDCIYGIFSASYQDDLKEILEEAILINTFQEMFQIILENYSMPTFKIGIGLGASQDLVIKAGKKGTGISDFIWIGNAVIDASKLSSQGSTDNFKPIVMDNCFYTNIKDKKANNFYTYSHYCNNKYSQKLGECVWDCDMVRINFDNWIKGGMK